MSTGEDILSWGYLHTVLSEGMVRMIAKTNSLTPLTYSSSKIPLVLKRMRQNRSRADTEQSAGAESSRYEVGDQVVMVLLVLPMCPTFTQRISSLSSSSQLHPPPCLTFSFKQSMGSKNCPHKVCTPTCSVFFLILKSNCF